MEQYQPLPEEMKKAEESMDKLEKASSMARELYLKLAEQEGISLDALEGMNLKLLGKGTGFSGEVNGVHIEAGKDGHTYDVFLDGFHIYDQFIAQKLYEKYLLVAQLSDEKTSVSDAEVFQLVGKLL
jgi:hypothetical protein